MNWASSSTGRPMGQLDDGVREEIEKHGLKLLGVLPQDEAVYRCDCAGEPSLPSCRIPTP